MSAGVGLAEGNGVLLAEPMQDRPTLKAAFGPLVSLTRVGFVSSQKANLHQGGEGAPHPGFGEPKSFVLGQGPPVDRDRT
ncbi:hypothetical protein [Methylobacterium indicum]|uniref:hypothetical protein n=1 Tax=Methylobacterium indicum TaxID=1775910 RepID=UPI001A935FCC|nr:hypothetical protein [Methylobacterium indicum]